MATSIFDDNNVAQAGNNNIFDTPIEETTPVASKNNEVKAENGDVYSPEELNEPNSINVNITDSTAPLVILFGPPSCGKTMTLVRLTRYLSRMGFTVAPIRNFRPSYDKNYVSICNGFDKLINSDDAADSTNRINFMLIEVMKNGKRICQILEAPGELYFNREKPSEPFPNFINTILNRNNRKIWAIMVEPNWLERADRNNYVTKIKKLKQRQRVYDKNIIVFNKIDMTNYVVGPGKIHTSGAQKEVFDLYPGLMEIFKNVNPITKLWRTYNCAFVPFQTGDYSQSSNGRVTFQEGPDEYPRLLWNWIYKYIVG